VEHVSRREREVLEAAGVGHRITHEDDLPDPRRLAAAVVRWLSDEGGKSKNRGAALAARVGRHAAQELAAELEGEDPGDAPDPTGALEQGSENTFLGKDRRPIATAHEEHDIPCEDCEDGPLATGAAHVFVNGKPIARRSDELDCGALVGEGERTVMIGSERIERTDRRPRNLPGTMLTQLGGPRYGRLLAGGFEELARRDKRVRDFAATGAEIGEALSREDVAGVVALLSR
jgi:uncharacterized Zn-binding protein involved in type VI secretion